MDKVKLVISNPTEDFPEGIRKAFSSRSDILVSETNKELDSLDIFFSEKKPSVLVIGPGWNPDEALSFAADFSVRFPYVSMLLVVKSFDEELLQRSIRTGIKDVLQLPLKKKSFLASVDAAARFSSSIVKISVKPPVEASRPEKKGQILTILGPKGGVGKTVVATNLAVYLALQKKNVYIVDLDLQFGDVAVMLKIDPKRSIYETVQAGDRLDREMLNSLVSIHKESGLKALLAPIDPDIAQMINEKQIAKVLEFLGEIADYIVIDTPALIDEIVLKAVDISDHVLLVASMDLPSVKSSKIAYGVLQTLNVPRKKINLILNRANSKVGLRVGDVEKSIGTKVYSKVPSHRLVPCSVNLGVPVVINSPRSEVSKSLQKLGKLILKEKVEVSV